MLCQAVVRQYGGVLLLVLLFLLTNPTHGFSPILPASQSNLSNNIASSSSSSLCGGDGDSYFRSGIRNNKKSNGPLFLQRRQWTTTDSNHQDKFSSTAVKISTSGGGNEAPGDQAGYFNLNEQNLPDWIMFTFATATVLFVTSYAWFLPTGPHLGDAFLDTVQSLVHTDDPAVTVGAMLVVFAVAHSGLAGLRPYAEELVGARAWRVVFATVSLPLALSCISYFVHHAHDGTHWWPSVAYGSPHYALWHGLFMVTNLVSFLFLYPSTFHLLEVAAIEEPQLRLWKPYGIIRITRHPQAVGQVLWCLAHTAYLGTSTAGVASFVLVSHHAYSVWHGDRRMRREHEAAFDRVREVTSVVPFQAVWEGRQTLPDDFLMEFATGPYLLIVGGSLAFHAAHPLMMAGAAWLNW